MSTYNAYEKAQSRVLDQVQKESMECISCPECSSQWFEEVEVNRYQINHNLILGQSIPEEPGGVKYQLLKCIRCNELLEPRILHSGRDVSGDRYDHFLDTLEGKNDTRKKNSNEISSEKL
jgi:hypothetical protein